MFKAFEDRAKQCARHFSAGCRVPGGEHIEENGCRQPAEGRQPADPERERKQADKAKERHDAIVD